MGGLPRLFAIGVRVGGSAGVAVDECGDLVHLTYFSPVADLFCLVFHVGRLVCPCNPLHCLVCFSILLPVCLVQAL